MGINCVCPRHFSFIAFQSNSKSGEFFFFTHDGKCMVKTVSQVEAQALIDMLEKGYLEHEEALRVLVQEPQGKSKDSVVQSALELQRATDSLDGQVLVSGLTPRSVRRMSSCARVAARCTDLLLPK